MKLLNFLGFAVLALIVVFVIAIVLFFLTCAFIWIVRKVCECSKERKNRLREKAEKNKKEDASDA